MQRQILFSFLIVMLVIIAGCSSSGNNPVNPVDEPKEIPDFALDVDERDSSYEIWGIWNLAFNPETMEITNTPSRELAGSFNVTALIPAPVITFNSYDPGSRIIDLDVTINNNSNYSGYDVRLIVYTDFIGHKLVNDDDWTNLFDIPGGFIGNPFKTYATSEPARIFTAKTEHTENVQIYIPPSGGNVQWAVTASFPGHCFEPYEIGTFSQTTLYETVGSSCTSDVDVFDWDNDLSQVFLYDNAITGVGMNPMTQGSGNTWTMELTNTNGVPAGDYEVIVVAYSTNSGSIALFDHFTVTVSEEISEEHGWAANFGGWSADYGRGVAIDSEGSFYCYGGYKSDDLDVDPDPLVEDIRTNAGSVDLFLSKFDKDGNWLWAYTWGGTFVDDTDERGTSIDIDLDDNVYITGRFYYTVDMDPTDEGVDEHTGVGFESYAFASKYNSDGGYVWTKSWGSDESDWGMTVACDGNDYVYIGGMSWGDIDLDPGPGEDWHMLNGPHSIFNWDGYLIKLLPNGDYVWGKTWGGPDADWLEGVSIDKDSNIILAGAFYETVDFNPEGSPELRTSAGRNDPWVMKLDPNGVFQWVNTWGGDSFDHGHHADTDSNGNIYVAGNFTGTVDFDPDPLRTAWISSNGTGRFDAFICSFNSSGDYRWGGGWGGTERDQAYDIAVDGSDKVYIIGKYQYTADFDITDGEDIRTSVGGEDLFLSVFQSNGDRIYTYTFGGESIEIGTSVDVTPEGVCGFTGYFASDDIPIDWDPGPEEYFLIPVGSVDPIIEKLMPDGYW